MHLRTLGLVSLAAIWTSSGVAATMHRTAPIDLIQADSHTRVGNEDRFWIKLAGPWPDVSCGPDWVWFNAKENPQMVATVLMAKATGTSLQIYVDDSLPKKDAYCQVFAVSL